MPRLTVTMPAYNAEATIKVAVTSTLRAMPIDSELVVLDDKSTDGTLKVLEKIKDSRLRILEAHQNSGGPASRRRLLAETDSDFVASIDADDISLPWRFSMQLDALEFADVCFSSAVRFGSVAISNRASMTRLVHKLRLRPSATVAIRPEEFPSALLFHNPVWHPSLLARRAIIEDVGGYHSARHGDDWDLWLRIAISGAKMYRMALPVIAYRESPKQASRNPNKAAAIHRNHVLRSSYVNLFNSLTDTVSLHPAERPSDDLVDKISAGLREQLKLFRPINKLHYSGIIKQRRIHFVLDLFPASDRQS